MLSDGEKARLQMLKETANLELLHLQQTNQRLFALLWAPEEMASNKTVVKLKKRLVEIHERPPQPLLRHRRMRPSRSMTVPLRTVRLAAQLPATSPAMPPSVDAVKSATDGWPIK